MPSPNTRALLTAFLLALAPAAWSVVPVTVENPYARAVPPGQPNSAVFMTLKNATAKPRALVEARSTAAKTVELHTHREEGGMMKMVRIDRIDIPAHGSVELKPGGLHVMLINLNGALKAGDEVKVDLKFDDGSEEVVVAPVRDIQPPKSMAH